MICNNPNLDLAVSMHLQKKYFKFYKFVLKILSRNQIMMDGMIDNPNPV